MNNVHYSQKSHDRKERNHTTQSIPNIVYTIAKIVNANWLRMPDCERWEKANIHMFRLCFSLFYMPIRSCGCHGCKIYNFLQYHQLFSPSFTNSMKRDRRTFDSESNDSPSDIEESLTPNSQQHLMDYGDSQSRNDYTEYCDKCFKKIREFYHDDPGLDTENKAFRCFSCSELFCPKHVV